MMMVMMMGQTLRLFDTIRTHSAGGVPGWGFDSVRGESKKVKKNGTKNEVLPRYTVSI